MSVASQALTPALSQRERGQNSLSLWERAGVRVSHEVPGI